MPKLMIIDDDRAMTSLLKTLLEMEGFDVTVVPRGMQAIEKASAEQPDAFIVDYHLTDMDGLEVVANLRNNAAFARTPIVMASGLDVEKDALSNGVDVFMLKPFEPGDLADVLSHLLS